MTTEAPFDEARLQELEADFGADDLAEIIDAFLEEAREVVDAIAGNLSDGPSQTRVEQFHFLAGAARNLGASRFGTLCQRLEKENGPFTEPDYEAFRAEYQSVEAYFSGGAGDLAATG